MTVSLPACLQHVVDVYGLVQLRHTPRAEAITEVARKRRVDPQTIRSACTRSLGITTAKLDELLLPENCSAFCTLLVRRFPSYQKEIEACFAQADSNHHRAPDDPGHVLRPLFPHEQETLLRMLLLEDVRSTLTTWTERRDVPEDVKRGMADIVMRLNAV